MLVWHVLYYWVKIGLDYAGWSWLMGWHYSQHQVTKDHPVFDWMILQVRLLKRFGHYTILNHLIRHPMNQKQACICQAHHHRMPVLSFPLIQAWAIYLQMNYHPLHHLGQCCNHHQILITKFLVSTFFMIFYFTSFLQGPHISFLRWHWYLEAFTITPWYPIFQFDIKWLLICSNISHIWRFLLQFQAWYI